jgi:hypothetical protein
VQNKLTADTNLALDKRQVHSSGRGAAFGAVSKITKHLGSLAAKLSGKDLQTATSKAYQMEVQYLLTRITKKKILSVFM